MSFITIVASTKFITVMSDGRASRGNVVVAEDMKKFIFINEGKLFVAIAGDYEYGSTFQEIFKTIDNFSPKEMIEGVYNKAQTLDIDARSFTISIGGVQDNKITVSMYDSDTNKTYHREPLEGNYDPIFFGEFPLPPEQMHQMFANILSKYETFPSHRQFWNA
ncbi:hypothetical protein [Paenibacillus silvae]|uniref:Uncharacterized protein n=1 Tax=Paenibacillus silvae TaxID=1325358 RepID=A0A2W6PCQ2_9BACL|nr:hypothetical protein [Paenibacillus silvae]PZT57440.1 hypothetical protein DN757_01945 [Paenibacillus silvae]